MADPDETVTIRVERTAPNGERLALSVRLDGAMLDYAAHPQELLWYDVRRARIAVRWDASRRRKMSEAASHD